MFGKTCAKTNTGLNNKKIQKIYSCPKNYLVSGVSVRTVYFDEFQILCTSMKGF